MFLAFPFAEEKAKLMSADASLTKSAEASLLFIGKSKSKARYGAFELTAEAQTGKHENSSTAAVIIEINFFITELS